MSEESDSDTLLIRVRRAVSATGARVERTPGKLLERVRETVDQTIAPAIEKKARQMLLELAEPEKARQLQQTLASLAQMAMRAGFRSDPQAKLLFELVDQLEQRHTRERVLAVVLEHAVTYESDLLEMLLSTGPARRRQTDELDGLRERAEDKLLTLLCALVALDEDEAAPSGKQAQIDYIEQSCIEERFKPLARMAAGDKRAFEAQTPRKKPSSSRLGGLLRRLTGDKATALTRFVPTFNDPATRFLTLSYLFFLESYLLRAMIEGLPGALEMIRDLERNEEATGDDIVDIGK